jgi:hypothetical protein
MVHKGINRKEPHSGFGFKVFITSYFLQWAWGSVVVKALRY